MRPTVALLLVAGAALAGCGGGTHGDHTTSATESTPTASVAATNTSAPAASVTATNTLAPAASVTATNTSAPSSVPTLARGFRLGSPAFGEGGAIPVRSTCHGTDSSPPLMISGVPPSARELVLVMRDPDAPGGDFVHWALAGIPPSTRLLPAGGVPGLVAPAATASAPSATAGRVLQEARFTTTSSR